MLCLQLIWPTKFTKLILHLFTNIHVHVSQQKDYIVLQDGTQFLLSHIFDLKGLLMDLLQVFYSILN